MTAPSRNPADDGTILGTLTQVLKKHAQSMDDMLPARVVAFDRLANMATVQILIQLVTTDRQRISRPQVAAVPVMQMGGGGFVLTFNLSPGDLGWIKANDRDISIFLQTYDETAPNTERIKSFSDAVFIPDAMMGFVIPSEDLSNATLQTMDGTQRVSVAPGYVKLSSGANFVQVSGSSVTAQVGTTSLSITASGIALTVGGTTMNMNGAGISSSGNWAHTGTLSANGIGLTTHRHSGVQSGGSNSGGPVA